MKWFQTVLLLTTLLLYSASAAAAAPPLQACNSAETIATNPVNGDVFVGAADELLHFSAGLSLVARFDYASLTCVTSPPVAAKSCAADTLASSNSSSSMLLMVDSAEAVVLNCGNFRLPPSGYCFRHRLADICDFLELTAGEKLVPRSDPVPATMVGLIAPTNIGEGPVGGLIAGGRDGFKWVIWNKEKTGFNLVYPQTVGLLHRSFLELRAGANRHELTYDFAFSRGGFDYFLFTEKNRKIPVTLGRVCKNDPYFLSYGEVEMKCEGSTDGYWPVSAAVVETRCDSGNCRHILNAGPQSHLSVLFHSKTTGKHKLCFFSVNKADEVIDSAITVCNKEQNKNVDTGVYRCVVFVVL